MCTIGERLSNRVPNQIQVATDQIVNQQLIEGGGGHGAQEGFGIGLPEVMQKQ
jgi:hypothetical protein